jgi:hemerythrin-like domain-containing protein
MSTPPISARRAFDVWLAAGDAGERTQDPADELVAEHFVMTTVLAAMEAEVKNMLVGRALRPEFWSDVVDFNGNFVHQCHRAKEEEQLVPMLIEYGRLEARREQAIREEHRSGKDLTLSLCEGVEEGDWEKVLRLVSIYVHILRPHMQREETDLFSLVASLPVEARARLREGIAAVERRALAHRSRRDFVAMARRLAVAAGVAHDLTPSH